MSTTARSERWRVGHFHRRQAILAQRDVVAGLDQHFAGDLPKQRIVIDDKHVRHRAAVSPKSQSAEYGPALAA